MYSHHWMARCHRPSGNLGSRVRRLVERLSIAAPVWCPALMNLTRAAPPGAAAGGGVTARSWLGRREKGGGGGAAAGARPLTKKSLFVTTYNLGEVGERDGRHTHSDVVSFQTARR